MIPLSPRELEVARLVAEDLEDAEIATILQISVRTVQEYLDRIGKKLRADTASGRRREIIRHYVRQDDDNRSVGREAFVAIWNKYVTDGRPAPLPASEWLYVIRRRDTHEVKIGVSVDPHARLKQLQTAHGCDLEIAAMIPASYALEHEAHQRFAAFRKKREWFDEAPELSAWIASLSVRHDRKVS